MLTEEQKHILVSKLLFGAWQVHSSTPNMAEHGRAMGRAPPDAD